MKLVYIAHPLRNDPHFNKARLSEILNNNFKSYQEMHVIPISPIHLFGYLDPGVDVMAECLELLYHCDELWVFGDWKNSTGTCEEIGFAKSNGIKIRYIEGDLNKSEKIITIDEARENGKKIIKEIVNILKGEKQDG